MKSALDHMEDENDLDDNIKKEEDEEGESDTNKRNEPVVKKEKVEEEEKKKKVPGKIEFPDDAFLMVTQVGTMNRITIISEPDRLFILF